MKTLFYKVAKIHFLMPRGPERIKTDMYAVVKFVCDGTYSEIPEKWICDDSEYCWWPTKSKNATSLMMKNADVDQTTWQQFKIEIEKLNCQTLDKARKIAIDNCYTSSEEVEHTGRGFRAKVQRKLSSSSDDDSREMSPPPSFERRELLNSESTPHSNKEKERIKRPALIEIGSRLQRKLPKLMEKEVCVVNTEAVNCDEGVSASENPGDDSIIAPSVSVSSNSTVTNDSFLSASTWRTGFETMTVPGSCLDKLFYICTDLRLKMNSIIKKLESMTDKGKPDLLMCQDTVNTYIPVTNENELKELEAFLSKMDNKKTFLNYLNQIGGSNPKAFMYRLYSRIFKNEFALKCSWLGLRGNLKVCDLEIIRLIRVAVTSEFPHFKECDFEKATAEWFRLAKLRFTREKGNQTSSKDGRRN